MTLGFVVILINILWKNKFTTAYDVMHTLGTEVYITPWARILPYMMGLACGWFLHQHQGESLPLSKVF